MLGFLTFPQGRLVGPSESLFFQSVSPKFLPPGELEGCGNRAGLPQTTIERVKARIRAVLPSAPSGPFTCKQK